MSGHHTHHSLGFRCRFNRIGSDVANVACRDGRRKVYFDAYDSSPYH